MARVLIAGCGDLGRRLGSLLAAAGHEVFALRRNPASLPQPLKALRADLADPSSLGALPTAIDWLVFTATPDRRDAFAYRRLYVDGLRHVVEALRAGSPELRPVFVSSTAVYGQDDGSEVDESSPTEPCGFNGLVLLEAERWLIAQSPQALLCRLSGLYGPGRERLLRQLQSGQARCQRDPPLWTNRIHIDDAAAALAHLMAGGATGIVNVSDPNPSLQCEVLDWLAQALGVPGPAATVGQSCGKRVLARRLIDSGFEYRYPDYQAGYASVLAAAKR